LNEKNSLREEILAGRKFGGLLPKLPNPQNCLPAKISSLKVVSAFLKNSIDVFRSVEGTCTREFKRCPHKFLQG